MFTIDTFRLIRKTFNRFFTIVMIVMIGIAFMMGLMSCVTIMKHSVDIYDDRYDFQDLQIYSSYGFDSADISAIGQLDIVKQLYPSRMIDCYADYGSTEGAVIRIREIDSAVNGFVLVDGRLPEKEDEVLGLSGLGGIKTGSRITLYLNDSDLSEQFTSRTVTVTGLVRSPEYMAKFAGTSNLNNRDISAVLYCPNSNFIADYYSSVFIVLDGSKELLSYTKDYTEYVNEAKTEIESFAIGQQESRKSRLLAEYRQDIEDGEKELLDKKAEGEKELTTAKAQLDDANIKLIVAQMQIDTNRATINTSLSELEKNEKVLNDSYQQVYDGIVQVEKQSGQSFDNAYQAAETAYNTYVALEAQLGNHDIVDQSSKRKQELIDQVDKNKERITVIENRISEIDSIEGDPDEELLSEKESLQNEKTMLETQNAGLEQMISAMDNITVDNNDATIKAALDRMDQEMNGSVKETYIQLKKLKEAKKQVDDGKAQLASGRKQIEEGQKALENAEVELAKGRREYAIGLKEYEDGLYEFNTEIEKAENDIRKAYQDLEELPEAKWIVLDRDSQYSAYMFKNNADQMGAIGISVPLLFYLVAALVCMTTMTRLIDEQRSQIGIYRALGFTKMQVIGKYCTYALIATLSGSLVGVPLGMLIFPTVVYETWRLMYYFPERAFVIDPLILLICISAFAVLIVGVTFLVARRSLDEMPAALMRPKAPKTAKKVFLEKIDPIWRRLSFTSKITARNLIRYKSRFFMTVIGVAGCTGLLVVGFGIRDSISDVVNVQYGKILTYNYNVTLESDKEIEQILDVLKSDYDNDKIVPYMTYNSKGYFDEGDETVTVQIYDQREAGEIMDLKDYHDGADLKLGGHGVIVSAKYAKNNNVKAGDMITIESKDGIKAQVRVDAIAEWYFQHYIFMADSYYQTVFGQSIRNNMIAVANSKGESLKKELSTFETVKAVTDFSGFIDQFNTMISALNIIIFVIIFTAGSLAFVVLINLTQVNISERLREIATLKVLGFRNNEVNNYIFKEILLLTVIGGLLGLPLGYAEERMIMSIINMDMIMFGTRVTPLSYLASFAITFVFTYIVLFATRRSLRNIEMIESLKSVE